MRKLLLSAAGVAVVLGAPAMAQDAYKGWYLKGGVGYGVLEEQELKYSGNGDVQPVDGEGDMRFMLGGGFDFGNGFRLEIEGIDRYSDLGAPSDTVGTADWNNVSVMANAIWDWDTGGRLSPYFGVGVGTSRSRLSAEYNAGGPGIVGAATNSSIAYQGLLGLGWDITNRTTTEFGYRYFQADDTQIAVTGGRVNFNDAQSHDFLVGLRFNLSAPRAAAAPAAAPAAQPVAQDMTPTCEDVPFVVYFEWDRSDLNDQSNAVISNAAARADACDISQVTIAGHADRSGSASYNVGLSERRARVVRDALIGEGVAASMIAIEAKGESEPAVATPDGAREPLNRRSEVVIYIQ